MTKDKDKTSNATFDNWDPDVNWQTSPWNYQGYFGVKKRELEAFLIEQVAKPEQVLPRQVEASTTAAGTDVGVSTASRNESREALIT